MSVQAKGQYNKLKEKHNVVTDLDYESKEF